MYTAYILIMAVPLIGLAGSSLELYREINLKTLEVFVKQVLSAAKAYILKQLATQVPSQETVTKCVLFRCTRKFQKPSA